MSDSGQRNVAVILVAAGRSSRMGGGESKVLRDLGGRPVLLHTLDTLMQFPPMVSLVVVCREDDQERLTALLATVDLTSVRVRVVPGGKERQDSVRAGLETLRDDEHVAVVLVHDAARPFASADLFGTVTQAASEHGACVPAVPVVDTLRRQTDDGLATVPRERLHAVQTPQGFQKSILVAAHDQAGTLAVTDDAMMAEAIGHPVTLVEGEPQNFKLTTNHDFRMAEQLLGLRGEPDMRIGLGQDLHRLEPGGPLRLGGIDVKSDRQAVGHSDGDVLLHAVTDAVLGALALGDIGQHFSDRDPAHRGRDSATMLERALELARERGFRPAQLDSVIHLETPKLSPYRDAMRQRMAELLQIDPTEVSIKAKTAEGLGPVGEGKALSCEVLIRMVSVAQT